MFPKIICGVCGTQYLLLSYEDLLSAYYMPDTIGTGDEEGGERKVEKREEREGGEREKKRKGREA